MDHQSTTTPITLSPWVPQQLPNTDRWMLYRVETRFDSQGHIACAIRTTHPRLFTRDSAIQLAHVFNTGTSV